MNPSIISINRMYQDSLQMQFITTKWLELHPSQNINNYAIKINTAQHDQLEMSLIKYWHQLQVPYRPLSLNNSQHR